MIDIYKTRSELGHCHVCGKLTSLPIHAECGNKIKRKKKTSQYASSKRSYCSGKALLFLD